MDEQRLDLIRKIAIDSTPGPFEIEASDHGGGMMLTLLHDPGARPIADGMTAENAALLMAARNGILELVAFVRGQQATIAVLIDRSAEHEMRAKPLKWHIVTSGPYGVASQWVAQGCVGASADSASMGLIVSDAGNLLTDTQFTDEESARKEARRRAGLRLLATALEMLAGE